MLHRRLKVGSLLLTALVLGLLGYFRRASTPGPPPVSPAASDTPGAAARLSLPSRYCVRVIDGDTIELDGGERVRLIGVDTPESVDPRRPVERFAKEAAAYTCRMVEGKSVQLEYGDESKDRYGRTLAYIYLSDGTLLNAEIIRQGYGFAYTRFPHPKMAEFVGLEREAREHSRGLWGP